MRPASKLVAAHANYGNPTAQLASVVVRPNHVAQKLEHLFIKDNNGTNILTVKFCLYFTQKYYAVPVAQFLKLVPNERS